MNDTTINALDVLGAVANAKAEVASSYIEAGTHILELEEQKLTRGSGTNKKCVYYIGDLKVLWSKDEVHAPGTTKTYVENLNDDWEQGPGRLKAFAMAMGPNMAEEDITKEDLAEMVNSQCCKGFRVLCHAWAKEKKTKPGEYITKYRWSYVDPSVSIEDFVAGLRNKGGSAPAENDANDA
jgi:hypothetical protein